jgi:hypothetical protein
MSSNLRADLHRPRSGGVPDEVHEQSGERDDEDHDDPDNFAEDAEIVATDNAYRDDRPDEEERCKRDCRQTPPERVREEHAPSLVR